MSGSRGTPPRGTERARAHLDRAGDEHESGELAAREGTADAAPSTWRPAPPSHRTADAAPSTWRPAPPSHRTADAGPAAAPRPELAPGASFGRFYIERLLGQGGMGRVYEARDSSLERRVALKVLRARDGADRDETMRRLLREARAVAALRHENVVSIYEAGEYEGTPYITMELLEGGTLRPHAADPAATLERRLGWSLEVASALAAAHEAGLVHRDVKPDNIFVCEGGRAKLLDFGVAKRGSEPAGRGAPEAAPSSLRTAEGHVVGTPRYMPPEQRAGRSADARSDQYAWALVTYELLCGSPDGASSPGVAARLRSVAPRLSRRAAAAFERALSADPSARFASMRDAIAELSEPLEREPPLFEQAPPEAGRALPSAGPSSLLAEAKASTASIAEAKASTSSMAEARGAHAVTSPLAARTASPRRPRLALAAAALAALAGAALVSLRDRLPAILPEPAALASPCALVGPGAANLGGPVPDALVPAPRGDALLLYGTFLDGSRVSSGLTRTRSKGAEPAFGLFEPYEPFLGVVSPAQRFLAPAFWRDEEVLAVYSNELGSFGVWGARGPVSAARLDHASSGIAALTIGETLLGVSFGLPKKGESPELVLVVMHPDSSPRLEVLHRAGPRSLRSPAALAAANGRAVVAFAADDRVLAIVLDERGRRRGEAIELARGEVGAPAVAVAGDVALLAWPQRQGEGGAYHLRAASLPLDGKPPGLVYTLDRAGPAAFSPALAPRGEGAIVAWPDGVDGRILIQTLAADASPTAKPLALEAPGGAHSLALSARPGGAWITWLEGPTPQRARAGALRCGRADDGR